MSFQHLKRYDSSNVLTENLKLPRIRDEQVAKILFLATKTEQVLKGRKRLKNQLFLAINQSRLFSFLVNAVLKLIFILFELVLHQGIDVNQDFSFRSFSSVNNFEDVIDIFRVGLDNGSIGTIRRALNIRLFSLKCYPFDHQPRTSVLENNFSDGEDLLSEEEEDILKFYEVFQMLSIPVTKFLEEKFDEIVKAKNIPVRQNEAGNKLKFFFVPTENKILSEICELLNPQDVCRMYSSLREDERDRQESSVFLNINIKEYSMTNVAGLKDVAFYFLVLNMIKQNSLNRLYTHTLEFVIDVVMSKYKEENEKDLLRFEKSLKMLGRYPVASHSPGLCIIFCMEEGRDGADKDLKNVKELFEKKYRYDVVLKINPTAQDIQTVITKLQAPRNKFYDSLVIWFMGHGTDNGLIVRDKEINRRNDFIQPFSNIEWLNKKPKLFFIQACATEQQKESISYQSKRGSIALEAETDSAGFGLRAGPRWKNTYGPYLDTLSVNNYADTLIAYATKWCEPAAREEGGSLYVQTVVDQLKRHGHTESIENVLREVHYNTNTVLLQTSDSRTWKQTPYYECSLQKEFVFPAPHSKCRRTTKTPQTHREHRECSSQSSLQYQSSFTPDFGSSDSGTWQHSPYSECSL